jgi:large subunit ribosomal protein L9
VTNADVAERLNSGGELDYEVEKRTVILDEPLKELGDHLVTVKLHTEVSVDIPVSIVREDA